MDDDNNLISNEDIDMLNSADIHNNQQQSKLPNIKQSDSPVLDSNGDSLDDDDSFMLDNETKTPGEILEEFCSKLSDINTTLPENVINYYMKKTGFIVNDPKLVKLVSIASQKFISEIVNDVMQHHKLRSKSTPAPASTSASATNNASVAASSSNISANNPTTSASAANQPNSTANTKAKASTAVTNAAAGFTLTLEDLTQVLTEYGINVKKPYYFM